MVSFHRLARHSFFQFSVALIAAASWLSGCGDDEEGDSGDGKGGSATGGSAGSTNGGSAGSTNGGSAGSTTGGSGGSPTGGSAGAPMGGSAGAPTGGSAGSAGAGMGGEGMGGEGMGGEGMGGEGMGGVGVGGEGGSSDVMCTRANLSVDLVSSSTPQQHDHVPTGASLTTLFNMIDTGTPLVFMLPTDGSNPHQHTLTFTAQQLTTLRNGGSIAMITSSTNGPAMNMHTHTYSIECAP